MGQMTSLLLQSNGKIMKRFVLALVLAALGSYSYATDVEVGIRSNVVAINDLLVGDEYYRVEFWKGTFYGIYQRNPELFPFIGDEAGAIAAEAAINNVLNLNAYARVGIIPAFHTYYTIPYGMPGSVSDLDMLGRHNYFAPSLEWTLSDTQVSYDVGIWVVMKQVTVGDVNNDGAVNISDLLKLERILTEP